MKKQLEITLDQAKELLVSMPSLSQVIYNSFPELKPKPIVLDRWEDLGSLDGYYIETSSIIRPSNCQPRTLNKNVYKTEKQALSSLAYAQLTQLMAATGDCDVDWNDYDKYKYCITRHGNSIKIDYFRRVFHLLAFNTSSVRDEFLQKHEGLIKQFFQL